MIPSTCRRSSPLFQSALFSQVRNISYATLTIKPSLAPPPSSEERSKLQKLLDKAVGALPKWNSAEEYEAWYFERLGWKEAWLRRHETAYFYQPVITEVKATVNEAFDTKNHRFIYGYVRSRLFRGYEEQMQDPFSIALNEAVEDPYGNKDFLEKATKNGWITPEEKQQVEKQTQEWIETVLPKQLLKETPEEPVENAQFNYERIDFEKRIKEVKEKANQAMEEQMIELGVQNEESIRNDVYKQLDELYSSVKM